MNAKQGYSLHAYEAHHRHPLNRAVHAIGIPVIVLSLVALVIPRRPFGWSRRAPLAALAGGWSLLWAGHAIEGNRPAVLTNPAAGVTALRWWVSRARRSQAPAIPRDGHLDSTLAFFREGYRFIGNRCESLQTDVFVTRLMLHKAVCMRGEQAAAVFYTPGRFTRRRAIPASAVMLLQDFRSVQMLDGAAHRHRKQMFVSMLNGAPARALAETTAAEWHARIPSWERRNRIVLHDEVRGILTAAVCKWAGVPLTTTEIADRARELGAMIDGAGRIGPQNWKALLRRRRTERWARRIIHGIRRGHIWPSDLDAACVIAWYRDRDGRLMPSRTAAVELINVLRPAAAIARFVTFAALALHEYPEWRRRLREQPADAGVFVQEVRRFYPFFPAVGGRVRQEFEWRGHRFSRGDWVLLDLYGTNHDPRVWSDPEAFRPERFTAWEGGPYNFIPQGGGRYDDGHRCPGEAATIEVMKTAVGVLTASMAYDVPRQDLRIRMSSIPALPASGFVIDNVRGT